MCRAEPQSGVAWGNRRVAQHDVAGFRAALARLIAAPETIPALSAAALSRVEDHFTWDQKARQIGAIYDWVLDPKGPIPQPVPLSGE